MLSVIQATTSAAVKDISGYIDNLNNYTSSYLSNQINNHITNMNNPHNVTAAQLNVYLCSQTSSAAEL